MEKPFIQLFRTPRGQYVFDVNQNEILPVSAEAFRFLHSCLVGKEDVGESRLPEIQALRERGYLRTDSAVQEIRHPYTDRLEDVLSRKLSHMTLQVTQGCNLRCKYCVYSEETNERQRSHSNRSMDWETAKRAIDFFYEHTVDSKNVAIGFYGGEPLLMLPLIKQILDYSRRLFDGKDVLYTMTTNGTLLTDETICFLAREKISLMISLDGPKEIHDRNRVFPDGRGSFDILSRNVARIKELAPDYYEQISLSMVMDPSNDFDCINELTVSGAEFNQFTMNAVVVETDYSDDSDVRYSEEYLWKYRYQQFLSLLTMFDRYPREKVSAILRSAATSVISEAKFTDISGPLRSVDVPSGPCVPGALRLLVNVDGKFFPCERVSERSEAMCIGSLDTGFDLSRARELLNVGAITKEACRTCWSFRHCSACAKKADDGSGQLSPKAKLSYCSDIRANAYEKMRQLILLEEAGRYYADQVRFMEGGNHEN